MKDDKNDKDSQALGEECVDGMNAATQRMKEDMARAPRKKYPKQYADSAINDAELRIAEGRAAAEVHVEALEPGARGTKLRRRLDDADASCAVSVAEARGTSEVLWTPPTD